MTLDEVIKVFEKACDLDQRCKDCSGCLAHDEGCPIDGVWSSIYDDFKMMRRHHHIVAWMSLPEAYRGE